MMFTPNRLSLMIALIGLATLSTPSYADDTNQTSQNPTKLPTLNVQVEHGVFQSNSVDAQTIQKKSAVDLKTALTDIPGVEVLGLQGTRQGNDSVVIRGLSGNHVAMSVDGVDLPEANENKYMAGQSVIFGRGAFIEPTSLSNISVRKNASGHGLGGAVEMSTLSPSDILAGEKQGGYVESAYNSVDRSTMLSGVGAVSVGPWRGMIMGTWRIGHETDNRGNNDSDGETRTKPDPLHYNSRYFLTKHEFDLDDHNTVSVGAEYLDRNQWMNVLSNLNSKTTSYDALDENKRTHVYLAHHYANDSTWINDLQTQVYWQEAKTDSDTMREGTGFSSRYYSPKGYRHQAFAKEDKVWGFSTKGLSHIDGNTLDQVWHYGLDMAFHDITSDWESNYHYVKSKPVANSKTAQINAFVDADLKMSWLMVSPGIGFHYYHFKPSNDGFDANSTSDLATIKSQDAFGVTPHIGFSFLVHPLFNPYIQYSRGFKAPSYQQLATSFNPGFYSIWGNPNLKPETSNNFELGFRGKTETVEYGLAVYDNYYRNFIDYVTVDSLPSQMFTYQYQNLDKAHIYGTELYGKWHFTEHWGVHGNLAYSRGTYDVDGEKVPLNSVSPFKLKVGLSYEQEQWGVSADLTYASKKRDKDIYREASTGGRTSDYVNPSRDYTLLDLAAYWKPTKHLTLNVGLNNVFNQKYWNWSDIAYFVPNTTQSQSDDTVSMTQRNVDRYSAPGRNFNVGLRYTF